MNTQTISPKKRHKARSFAVQALYQWQLTGDDVTEILVQFVADMNPNKTDIDYFQQILRGVPANISRIDSAFESYLDRALGELGPIELSVIRLAVYELIACPELPYKIVLNEAIELAKVFGPEESHKYINGILDKVAGKIRAVEVKAMQA
jgi:N utilization substance protein B